MCALVITNTIIITGDYSVCINGSKAGAKNNRACNQMESAGKKKISGALKFIFFTSLPDGIWTRRRRRRGSYQWRKTISETYIFLLFLKKYRILVNVIQ